MGLLDEAIRDHLELKRRRGADPSEIARAEREALDPLADEGSTEDNEPFEADGADGQAWDEPPEPPEGDWPDGANEPEIELDPRTTGQETVEIDMQALLAEDASAAGGDGAQPAIRARALAGRDDANEELEGDPLDWEVPDRMSSEMLPEQIPGQERLSFE